MINGSLKEARSNTMRVTDALAEGFGGNDAVHTIDLSRMAISSCRGCCGPT